MKFFHFHQWSPWEKPVSTTRKTLGNGGSHGLNRALFEETTITQKRTCLDEQCGKIQIHKITGYTTTLEIGDRF